MITNRATAGGRGITIINGTPVAIYIPPITPQLVQNEIAKSASCPYEPLTMEDGTLLPGEHIYEGKTRLEVALDRNAVRASRGDVDALDRILDRTIGKPKQSVESISMSMTYQDWVTNSTKPPTSDELADIGLTIEDITDRDTLDLEGL